MIETIIQRLFGLLEAPTFGGVARSPKFAQLSRDCIKEANGLCQMGLHKPTLLNPLNTHHILEFHNNPTLELLKSNLIVLCRFHHYAHGHFFNWKDANHAIRENCSMFNCELKEYREAKVV